MLNQGRPKNRGIWECVPDHIATPQSDFSYPQPCTPPQFFHADHDNPRQTDGAGNPLDSQWYDPALDLKAHYLDRAVDPPPESFGDDPCRDHPGKPHDPVTGSDWRRHLVDGADR